MLIKDTRLALKYYRLSVRFSQDHELLLQEFGAKSMVVVIAIYEKIFSINGYYLEWDSDSRFSLSKYLGGIADPDYIEEVVAGCIRRGLFDKSVFDMFKVLTSRNIQLNCLIGNKDAARHASEEKKKPDRVIPAKPYKLDERILLLTIDDFFENGFNSIFKICLDNKFSEKYWFISWKYHVNSKKNEHNYNENNNFNENENENVNNKETHIDNPGVYVSDSFVSCHLKRTFKIDACNKCLKNEICKLGFESNQTDIKKEEDINSDEVPELKEEFSW